MGFRFVREAISSALSRVSPRDVDVPADGRFVSFRLADPRTFHPALYATMRVGARGTLLTIGTPLAQVRRPRELGAFLARMGWRARRWTRRLSDEDRRSLVYQLRAAGVIGGSRAQRVLIPRARVEAAVARFAARPEVRRIVAANVQWPTRGEIEELAAHRGRLAGLRSERDKLLRLLGRPMAARSFQSMMRRVERLNSDIAALEGRKGANQPGLAARAYRRAGIANPLSRAEAAGLLGSSRRSLESYHHSEERHRPYFQGRAAAYADAVHRFGPRAARKSAARAMILAEHPHGAPGHRPNPLDKVERRELQERSLLFTQQAAQYPLKSRRHGYLVGRSEEAFDASWRFAGRNPLLATLGFGNPGRLSFEEWMREVDGAVQRRAGLSVHDLPDAPFGDWYEDGVSPRSAAARALRSSGENRGARKCPPGMVRSRKGRCVPPIGVRARRGALAGWSKSLPAARRRAILAGLVRRDGYATVVRRLTYLVNISADEPARAAARADRAWLQATRGVAVRRVAANPYANPAVRVPFRTGQKVTTEQVLRFIATLPEPIRRAAAAKFEQARAQYKRFHKTRRDPPRWTFLPQALGMSGRMTDIDFVVSEGKEWAAMYQVPAHSGKFERGTQGRYIHSHGESGIEITNIKRPVHPSRLPERFHTADGKFAGVLIGRSPVKIGEWYTE